jgi:hypothetical protein
MNVTGGTAPHAGNTETGHLCFVKSLQNEPVSTVNVLYVFYDFETTQDAKSSRAMFQI